MSTSPRRFTKTCRKCGDSNHETTECKSKYLLCFNCKEAGHFSAVCPQPRGIRAKCTNCKQIGHYWNNCPDLQCSLCGGFGHATRTCSLSTNRPQTSAFRSQKESNERTNNDFSTSAKNRTSTDKTNAFGMSNEKGRTENTQARGTEFDIKTAEEFKELGNAAYNKHDFETAILHYSEAIRHNPKGRIYYSNRGAAYLALKRFGFALTDLNTSESLNSSVPTPKILTRIARCYFSLGLLDLALQKLESIESPDDSAKDIKTKVLTLQKYLNAFRNHKSEKQWEKAQESYEKCNEIISREGVIIPIDLRCWEISYFIIVSDWDSAENRAIDLRASQPTSPEILIVYCLVQFLKANLETAKSNIAQALKLDPDNKGAKKLRSRINTVLTCQKDGIEAFDKNDFKKASQMFSDALMEVSDDVEEGCGGRMRAQLLHIRASTYLKVLNQLKEAHRDIQNSIKLWPTTYKVFRTSGRINVKLHLYNMARCDFQQALELLGADSRNELRQSLKDELKEAQIAEQKQKKQYYEILGLTKDCTYEEIRKAYKRQSLKYHPDKGGLVDYFNLVKEAYETLLDPDRRSKYNDTL